jgi:hypothetical protein
VLLDPARAPGSDHEFSLAFDTGEGTPISADAGTRAALVSRSATGRFFARLMATTPTSPDSPQTTVEVPPGSTAEDVLTEPTAPTPQPSLLPTDAPSPDPTSSPEPTPAGTGTPLPSQSPPTSPAPVPLLDWTTCSGAATRDPAITVDWAQLPVLSSDTRVWWTMPTDRESRVAGFKVCAELGVGPLTLLSSTGPGTASVRTQIVRSDLLSVGVVVTVVVVMDDGSEVRAANSCLVSLAAKPKNGHC